MTALPIYRTSRPTPYAGPILPMAREDETFWRLRKERRAALKKNGIEI